MGCFTQSPQAPFRPQFPMCGMAHRAMQAISSWCARACDDSPTWSTTIQSGMGGPIARSFARSPRPSWRKAYTLPPLCGRRKSGGGPIEIWVINPRIRPHHFSHKGLRKKTHCPKMASPMAHQCEYPSEVHVPTQNNPTPYALGANAPSLSRPFWDTGWSP